MIRQRSHVTDPQILEWKVIGSDDEVERVTTVMRAGADMLLQAVRVDYIIQLYGACVTDVVDVDIQITYHNKLAVSGIYTVKHLREFIIEPVVHWRRSRSVDRR